MPNLNEAVERFDHWMRAYEASHRRHGAWENHNKALLRFLKNDLGFRYIKTYAELCQLADLVQEKGYSAVRNPPCFPEEFNLAITHASPESFGETVPIKAVRRLTTICYAALVSKGKKLEVAPEAGEAKP